MNNDIEKRVVVTDIRMPFLSMMIFMIKWVIASIPAFIILSILGGIVTAILGKLIPFNSSFCELEIIPKDCKAISLVIISSPEKTILCATFFNSRTFPDQL